MSVSLTIKELNKKSVLDNWEISRYFEIKYNILKIPWVKAEVSREIRKYFQLNENENTPYTFSVEIYSVKGLY